MEINREAVLKCFLAETDESLGAMEQGLLRLETHPDDAEQLNAVFRVVHNLKGNAGALDFSNIAEFAHALESLLDKLRHKELSVTTDVTSFLLKAVDALRGSVSRLRLDGSSHNQDFSGFLRGLDALSHGEAGPAANAPEHGASPGEQSSSSSSTLRVDLEKVDRLVNLAGEIAIARGRLSSALRAAGMSSEMIDLDLAADALCSEMQELVMRLRMVPLGPSFAQLERTVRDTAKRSGKIVRLEVSGGDVELDARVIDLIRNPLVHLIRNAIDHGIEAPGVRRLKGKLENGTITLMAGQDGGNVVITVRDDGAGLNRERLLQRARTMGLVSESDTPNDQDLFQLVFEPGFSTADRVTDISGRGVGMDVVRRNITSLRGSVTIESEPGTGTAVVLRIPLTLAIIDGFAVQVGCNPYVIPLDCVLECIESPAGASSNECTGVVPLRGEPLPYIRLRRAFELERPRESREHIVVVRNESGCIGLAVDALDGEIQAVVKPLGKTFASATEFSGSTILGDGRVALLLDVTRIAQRIKKDPFSAATNQAITRDLGQVSN